MGFGDIIKKARTGKFSQQTLGKQIGVWGTYIGQIEKGERVPSDERCIQLANALELAPLKLLISAYRERSHANEAKALFTQMEKLISDPVISQVVSNPRLLTASLLKALKKTEIRRALKDPKWQEAICQAMSDSDRDLPLLISIASEMPPQQWTALLNTAKALAGVQT
ncbi:MAG: helix-turn-helix transcriptional regulator [bacterium]|nr:helix-turn-helix transcriptional regulator [bacterium]